MLKKAIQRLSDPIFYRRRRALFTNWLSRKKIEPVLEFDIDDLPNKRILVVIAHPDDEVFCSGLLCELRTNYRSEIHVLCLTKGEGGPLPEGVSRRHLGEIREAEMKESCEILGIEKLTFLGHIDPVGLEFKTFAPNVSRHDLARQIGETVATYKPDFVLTHGSWGEYWHPAHLLVHDAVLLVAEDKETPIVTFNARRNDCSISEIINHADPANLKCDFTGHFKTRLAALEAHRSQLSLFSKFSPQNDHADFVQATSLEHYSIKNLPASMT